MIYDFTLIQSTNLISLTITEEQPLLLSNFIKIKITDIILFVKITFKIYYDKKYRDITLKKRDFALLHLNYGYKILLSQILGLKLFQ